MKNSLAIYFGRSSEKDEVSLIIDTIKNYIDSTGFNPEKISIIHDEKTNVKYYSKDGIDIECNTMEYAINNFQYLMYVSDNTGVNRIEELISRINLVYDYDDGIAIEELDAALFAKYVKDAYLIPKNEVESFINIYLETLSTSENKKEINKIKEGLDILRKKL